MTAILRAYVGGPSVDLIGVLQATGRYGTFYSATDSTLIYELAGSPTLRLVYTGTGLTFDGSNRLTGGVITSLALQSDGNNLGTLERISQSGLAIQSFIDQLHAGGGAPVQALLSQQPVVIYGSAQNDNLPGGNNNDVFYGAAGNDTFFGAGGDDYFYTGLGADAIYGESGWDVVDYSGSTAAVTAYLNGGPGIGGQAEGDTLNGVEGLVGSAYSDTLVGDDYDNSLQGNAGSDTLIGGGGYDEANYISSTSGVTINLAVGMALGGHAQGGILVSIEDLGGSAFADSLTGNDLDNWLHGRGGADYLNGGNGVDTAMYWESLSGVVVSLASGTGAGGDAAGDVLVAMENLQGSRFNDSLTGDFLNNQLRGLEGNDALYGQAGDDVLIGGAGGDAMFGGQGTDLASYEFAGSSVMADLAVSENNTGEGTGDTYTLVEGLIGSNFGDVLRGDAANNALYGRAGDDQIYGGVGGDNLVGGAGDDELYGGKGFDTLRGGIGNDLLAGALGSDILDGGADIDAADYGGADTGIIVDLLNLALNTGHAAGDSYIDVEGYLGSTFNDDIRGNAAVNIIGGNKGNDIIYGRGGDDLINGEAGDDQIHGGAGNDDIYFGSGGAEEGDDIIYDFVAGPGVGDQIYLNAGSNFDTFAEVAAVATTQGNSTVLNFGAAGSITLIDVLSTSLVADDFMFFA